MFLERIDSPEDLKGLNIAELSILSEELRRLIIDVVSKTGGHLSSSLGAVELTIALHYVFDTPEDKVIFDVGHQCYAHKIITGRRARFNTLRQDDGISGFPSRAESIYDVFNTGHASNSISIATGLAEAKKKMGDKYRVIAVIGDGSLTGGMAFEALNHAGHLKSDIIVILNDNEMSISKNIGAMSSYLSKIMTGEFMSRMREDIKQRIKRLPAGERFYKLARQIEELIKGLLTPGLLFEEFGFQYIGPVDGHNLNHLIEAMKNIKRFDGPILMHVITQKGKGYVHAESDPCRFHGISTFEIETGNSCKTSKTTYTDIFGSTIIELASMDERVVAVTAAMGLGTGLERFSQLYPERFYDIGIAEAHGVTFAAALALGGLRPYVAIYSTFLQRAYDQIITDVCLQGIPLVFAADRSGLVGQDGPTHHGVFDLSYFRHIPEMVIMAPKDGDELRHMLYSAYLYERPVVIRYPRGEAEGCTVSDRFNQIPFGRWERLKDGEDIAIIACGNLVLPSLYAAIELEKEGIRCAVINARFIKPMDRELLIEVATKSGRILTVEENAAIGGFGSGVMEVLSEEDIIIPVKRLGIPDRFIPHGLQKTLRIELGLTSEGIKEYIRWWLKRG